MVLFDPSCEDARRLESTHAREMRAMVDDPTSRLAEILAERHSRERSAHYLTCAECYGYEPPCQHCGRDLRKSSHGWLCKAKESRWSDLAPSRWPAFAKPQPPARPVGPPPGIPPSLQPPERRPSPAPAPRRAPVKGRTVPVQEPPRPKKATPTPTPAAAPRAKTAPPPPPPPRPKRKEAPPPPPPPPPKQEPRPDSPPPAPPRHSAPDKPDPYAILGLSAGASLSDVRKAFREKAQQYHPDKVMHLAPEFREIAETRMRQLNDAYHELREKLKAAEASV